MSDKNMSELLAWYANGTLEARERAEVEAWLEENPEARIEMAEYRFLNETVAEESADEPQFNLEAGFDKLMSRIEAEEQAANETLEQGQPEGMLNRLSHWLRETLQWNMTPSFAKVAVVSQFAVVMALGAVLLVPGEKQEGYEVLSGSPPLAVTAGVQADIGLSPTLNLAQFQQLLRDHEAMIVAGPSGIGVYRIQLPEAQAEQRLASLKNHSDVIYLQRIAP